MENKTKLNRREALHAAGAAGLGLLLAGLNLTPAMAQDAPATGRKGRKKDKGDAAAKGAGKAKADRAARGYRFHHIGIPTQTQHENEKFLEESKVYITDPEKDQFHIEWCRWMPDSPAKEKMKTTTHVAFEVKDVDKEISKWKPEQVFAPPFVPFPGARVAFIEFEGLLVEFLQKTV